MDFICRVIVDKPLSQTTVRGSPNDSFLKNSTFDNFYSFKNILHDLLNKSYSLLNALEISFKSDWIFYWLSFMIKFLLELLKSKTKYTKPCFYFITNKSRYIINNYNSLFHKRFALKLILNVNRQYFSE